MSSTPGLLHARQPIYESAIEAVSPPLRLFLGALGRGTASLRGHAGGAVRILRGKSREAAGELRRVAGRGAHSSRRVRLHRRNDGWLLLALLSTSAQRKI